MASTKPEHGSLDILHFAGDAYDIGRQHGEALGPFIRETALNLQSRLAQFDQDSLEKTRVRMLATMVHECPWVIQEMEGIGVGAGLDERTGQFLSLHTAFGNLVEVADGCTNLAFSQSDRGPLLGKTLDASRMDSHRLMVTVKPEVGHAFVAMLAAGRVHAETGLNAEGLAVGASSIHFKTQNPGGINRNIMTRLLLQTCATTAEAVAFLEAHPTINRCYNFLLVDRKGDIANVERGPTTIGIRRPSNGVLHCANHCQAPSTAADENLREDRRINSHARTSFLTRVTEDAAFTPTLAGMEAIIKSHEEPAGFCQHGSGNLHSFTGYLMIPEESRMIFWPGYPCSTPPQELRILN